MKKTLFILIPIFIVLGSMGISARASADDEIFLLKHDGKNNYMEFVVKEGQQGSIDFELCNTSGEKKTNYVLVYDSITAINGGNVVMTPENLLCEKTSAWFETNKMEVVQEPGQCRSYSLMYEIPDSIPDGVYTAILGLYAYSSDTALDSEDVTLKIDSNYTSTIAIIFRIGKDSSAEFKLGEGIELICEGSTGNSYMLIPIENFGSAYGFPTLEYLIYDENGIELQSGSMKLDIFYRLTSSKAAVLLEKGILTTGSYKAEIKILTSNNNELQDSASYTFEMDDKSMKEVIRNRLENQGDSENDSAWKSDFIVLGKRELIFGSAGILGVAFISVTLIVLLKGRNGN